MTENPRIEKIEQLTHETAPPSAEMLAISNIMIKLSAIETRLAQIEEVWNGRLDSIGAKFVHIEENTGTLKIVLREVISLLRPVCQHIEQQLPEKKIVMPEDYTEPLRDGPDE